MRLAIVTLSLWCIAGPAHADNDEMKRGNGTVSLANAEVNGLIRDGELRAITGYTNRQPSGHWLVVERLANNRVEWQYLVRVGAWGRTVVNVREVRAVQLSSLRGNVLAFRVLYEGRDWLDCSLDLRPKTWATACNGKYTGTGSAGGGTPVQPPTRPAPAPREPSMAEIEAITGTCNNSFLGITERNTCVRHLHVALKGRFFANASKIAPACSQAFLGITERLACIAHSAVARREPTEVTAYCAKNNLGINERLACIKDWMQK